MLCAIQAPILATFLEHKDLIDKVISSSSLPEGCTVWMLLAEADAGNGNLQENCKKLIEICQKLGDSEFQESLVVTALFNGFLLPHLVPIVSETLKIHSSEVERCLRTIAVRLKAKGASDLPVYELQLVDVAGSLHSTPSWHSVRTIMKMQTVKLTATDLKEKADSVGFSGDLQLVGDVGIGEKTGIPVAEQLLIISPAGLCNSVQLKKLYNLYLDPNNNLPIGPGRSFKEAVAYWKAQGRIIKTYDLPQDFADHVICENYALRSADARAYLEHFGSMPDDKGSVLQHFNQEQKDAFSSRLADLLNTLPAQDIDGKLFYLMRDLHSKGVSELQAVAQVIAADTTLD